MIQICRTKFWLSLAHISFSTMDIQQNFYIPVFSTVGFEHFLIQPHCFCINKYYQVLFIATCERAIVSCSLFYHLNVEKFNSKSLPWICFLKEYKIPGHNPLHQLVSLISSIGNRARKEAMTEEKQTEISSLVTALLIG